MSLGGPTDGDANRLVARRLFKPTPAGEPISPAGFFFCYINPISKMTKKPKALLPTDKVNICWALSFLQSVEFDGWRITRVINGWIFQYGDNDAPVFVK